MSLEDDVKQLLWSAVTNQAAGIDALVSGREVGLSSRQLVEEVVVPTLAAQSEALVRIAQAVDALG